VRGDTLSSKYSALVKKKIGKVISLDFILLFLDEKKQKSTDRTEFTKNLMLKLKSFNSTRSPERFLNA